MEFKEYTLSEVAQIISGGTPKRKEEEYWNGNIPWLSIKDFNNDNRMVYQTEEYITLKGVENSSAHIVPIGTVVISARGTVGELTQVGVNMTFNQSCFGLSANLDLTSNEYLYYWLKSKSKTLKNYTHGSVFDTINRKTFDNIKIKLPNQNNQRKIAQLLVNLDNKIQKNNQIIAYLEELSQALFKQWFVDFEFPDENGNPYKSSGGEMVESELGEIPKVMSVNKLSEVAEVIMGQSPKSETYNTEKIGIPLLNGASDFKNQNLNPSKYTTDPKRIGRSGDYVFGVRATVGLVTELDNDYAVGRGAGIARTDKEYKEWLFEILNKAFIDFERSIVGSIYINISSKDLKNYLIVRPPINIMRLYHDKLKDVFTMKSQLNEQNQNLISLRDILLPKLMSGEIEIPDDVEVDEGEL